MSTTKHSFFWSQFVTTQFTQCMVLHVRWYNKTTQVNVHQWSRISKILECSVYISTIWYSLPLQCLSFCLQITFLQPLTPGKRVCVNGLSKRWSVIMRWLFILDKWRQNKKKILRYLEMKWEYIDCENFKFKLKIDVIRLIVLFF